MNVTNSGNDPTLEQLFGDLRISKKPNQNIKSS